MFHINDHYYIYARILRRKNMESLTLLRDKSGYHKMLLQCHQSKGDCLIE